MQTDLDAFLERLAPLRGLWPSIDVRVGAVKSGDSEVAFHLCARLDPRRRSELPRPGHEPSVDGYSVYWEALDAEAVEGLVRGLGERRLRVDGHDLMVGRPRDSSPVSLSWFSGFQVSGSPYHESAGIDGTCVYLHSQSTGIGELSDPRISQPEIEHRWRAAARSVLSE